jgi:type II secretory ATPase GspE/PulE/Tfp pilus assembly ATPase PilB-like protein
MRASKRQLAAMSAGAGLFLAEPAAVLAADTLATLPEPGGYASWLRIILVFLCMLPWLAFCQWVDKDTEFVRRMRRDTWNGITLGGGVVGLIVWLLPPWNTAGLFAAGFGLWFLATVGACAAYVVVRNGHVDANSRVFTVRHIKNWMGSLGKKQELKKGMAIERVRLNRHNGEKVPVPTDPNQTDAFEAAQNLLFDALWRRATEVEMLIGANDVRLAYRIDGVGTPRADTLTRDAAVHAINLIKAVGGLDVEERRRPQQGSLTAVITGTNTQPTEIEVRTSGTTQYEKLSLRIVGEENRLRMGDLGMSDKQLTALDEVIRMPSGLVIVSGSHGSGLTSTLYAALRNHDAFMQNLLTIEREPLMDLENITQNIYDSTKHEASYARQLQTVLRREPDVVMISDCSDRETAHLAAKAACDGKKIYMGVQARDTFDALKKLVSLAGDLDTVAKALVMLTSQRLVRKLCIACRQPYKPDLNLLKKANLPADKIDHFFRPPPGGLVDAKGNPILCTNCQGSGYFGRTGVFELLQVDDGLRDLIAKGQPVSAIRAMARKNGMLYLQEVGLQKVMDGVTSMTELLRVMREEESGANNQGPPASAPRPKKPKPEGPGKEGG